VDVAEHGRRQVLSTSITVYEERHGDDEPTRYFISHKFPLLDGEGHVFAVGGITTEVSELRRMELRLQLAMQVFSKGTEGILICDDEARVVAVNRAFETITGYTEAEVLGQNPRILSSGKHAPEFFKALWETVATEGRGRRIWNRRPNGGSTRNARTSAA
jgi:PAS domain S-box-containing protein